MQLACFLTLFFNVPHCMPHIATRRSDTARHAQEIKGKIPNDYELPAPLSAAGFVVDQRLACCKPQTGSAAAGQVEIVRHSKSLDDWKRSHTHSLAASNPSNSSKQESGKSSPELMCLPNTPSHTQAVTCAHTGGGRGASNKESA